MIIKEWTIDETGRTKATWVTRERPSSLEYLMKRGIIASDCDAIVPLTRPVENEVRISMPVEGLPQSDSDSTGGTGSSDRKWTWIYTILKGICS